MPNTAKVPSGPPKRPFKKFYCDWRSRIFRELTGAALKVWMYHYLRSNGGDESRPGIDLICEETGLARTAVVHVRRALRAAGWLVPVEGKSKFKAKTLRAVVPEGLCSTTPIGSAHPRYVKGNKPVNSRCSPGNSPRLCERQSRSATAGGVCSTTFEGSRSTASEVDSKEVGSTEGEKTTHDAASRQQDGAKQQAGGFPFNPFDEAKREPEDILFTAAKVLVRKYGEDGINLAMYIAAHCINGTGRWPETTAYYKTSADGYLPDGDDVEFVREGITDGNIHPTMIENAGERLSRAVDRIGGEPDEIIYRLEGLRAGVIMREHDAGL
jgi:hypothetical protein